MIIITITLFITMTGTVAGATEGTTFMVENVAGDNITGVNVGVWQFMGMDALPVLVEENVTDENGKVVIEISNPKPVPYLFTVNKEGYKDDAFLIENWSDVENRSITLSDANRKVSLNITNNKSENIENATIIFISNLARVGSTDLPVLKETDENGEVDIEVFIDNGYGGTNEENYGYTVTKEGYSVEEERIKISGGDVSQDTTLLETDNIKFNVENESGDNVKNATVEIIQEENPINLPIFIGNRKKKETDENGEVIFKRKSENYFYNVSKDGYLTVFHENVEVKNSSTTNVKLEKAPPLGHTSRMSISPIENLDNTSVNFTLQVEHASGYLFAINEPTIREALNNENVSEMLKDRYKDKGYPIESANVKKRNADGEEADEIWNLTDGVKGYNHVIKNPNIEEEGGLKVYDNSGFENSIENIKLVAPTQFTSISINQTPENWNLVNNNNNVFKFSAILDNELKSGENLSFKFSAETPSLSDKIPMRSLDYTWFLNTIDNQGGFSQENYKTLVFSQMYSLEGYALNQDENPIKNAEAKVTVWRNNPNPTKPGEHEIVTEHIATSNNEGYFKIEDIPGHGKYYRPKITHKSENLVSFNPTQLPNRVFANLGTVDFYMENAVTINVSIYKNRPLNAQKNAVVEENYSIENYSHGLEWDQDENKWAYVDNENRLAILNDDFSENKTVKIPMENVGEISYWKDNIFLAENIQGDVPSEVSQGIIKFYDNGEIKDDLDNLSGRYHTGEVRGLEFYDDHFYISGSFENHIFSIDENIDNIVDNLNAENISKELIDNFEQEDYTISKNDDVTVHQNDTGDNSWEVKNSEQGYYYNIRKEGENLKIYTYAKVVDKYNTSLTLIENNIGGGSRFFGRIVRGEVNKGENFWYIFNNGENWVEGVPTDWRLYPGAGAKFSNSVEGFARNDSSWHYASKNTGKIYKITIYCGDFEYSLYDKATGKLLGESLPDFVEKENFYLPAKRNYSIEIRGTLSGGKVHHSFDDIREKDSWKENRTIDLKLDTTDGLKQISGHVKKPDGTNNFDNLFILPFSLRGNRAWLYWPDSINRGIPWNRGADNFVPEEGYYEFVRPSNEYGEKWLLFFTAEDGGQHYGGMRTVTLYNDNDDLTGEDLTLYPLLGDNRKLSLNTFDGEITVPTTLKEIHYLSEDGTGGSPYLSRAKIDYSEHWESMENIWMSGILPVKMEQYWDKMPLPIFENVGVEKLEAYGVKGTREATLSADKMKGTGGVELILSRFDPGGISGESFSDIKFEIYKNKPQYNVPNPDSEGLLWNASKNEFNPWTVMLGGGDISFRIRKEKDNITVHYNNVNLLRSGPPDALFKPGSEDVTVDGSLAKAWQFGSMGPEIYDNILIGVPYNESEYSDTDNFTVRIGKFYDDDWNVIWNIKENTLSELPDEYTTYKNEPYRAYIDNEMDPIVASETDTTSIVYADTDNHMIWMRIPHFSGVQPTIIPQTTTTTEETTQSEDDTTTTTEPTTENETTTEDETTNQLPTAKLDGPYKIEEGKTIQLDGTQSTDPDGTINSYNWTITDDPTGKATLTNPNTATPTFNAPTVEENETVKIQLTVTDNNNATHTSTTYINIQAIPPALTAEEIENNPTENATKTIIETDAENAGKILDQISSTKASEIINEAVNTGNTEKIGQILSKMNSEKAAFATIEADTKSAISVIESIIKENINSAALISDSIAKQNLEKAGQILENIETTTLTNLLIKIYELPHTPEIAGKILNTISNEKSREVTILLLEDEEYEYVANMFEELSGEKLNTLWNSLTETEKSNISQYLSSSTKEKITDQEKTMPWLTLTVLIIVIITIGIILSWKYLGSNERQGL